MCKNEQKKNNFFLFFWSCFFVTFQFLSFDVYSVIHWVYTHYTVCTYLLAENLCIYWIYSKDMTQKPVCYSKLNKMFFFFNTCSVHCITSCVYMCNSCEQIDQCFVLFCFVLHTISKSFRWHCLMQYPALNCIVHAAAAKKNYMITEMNDAPFSWNGSFGTNGIICKKKEKTKQRLSGIYFNTTKIDPKRNFWRMKEWKEKNMQANSNTYNIYTFIVLMCKWLTNYGVCALIW